MPILPLCSQELQWIYFNSYSLKDQGFSLCIITLARINLHSDLFSPLYSIWPLRNSLPLPILLNANLATFSIPDHQLFSRFSLLLHSSLPYHLPSELEADFTKYRVKCQPQILKSTFKTGCNQLLGKDPGSGKP